MIASKRFMLAPWCVLTLVSAACGPRSVPIRMAVQIVAEPDQAAVTFKGKEVGETPTSITIGSFNDLMAIAVRQEGRDVVEKRVRFLSAERAELIFRFGSAKSPLANALGLSKILIFDYSEHVCFDTDRFDLKPQALPILQKQAELLRSYFPRLPVYVCGHSDSTGTAEHNLDLSLRRAQAVSAYLEGHGVPGPRLRAQGFGEEFPIEQNASASGRAMNRRTEVVLEQ